MRGAKYDLVGAAARAALINDHAWVITDGGPVTGASMNNAFSKLVNNAHQLYWHKILSALI